MCHYDSIWPAALPEVSQKRKKEYEYNINHIRDKMLTIEGGVGHKVKIEQSPYTVIQ